MIPRFSRVWLKCRKTRGPETFEGFRENSRSVRQSISSGMQTWTSCNDDKIVDALDVCTCVLCMNFLEPNKQPCCGPILSSPWGSVMAGTTELTGITMRAVTASGQKLWKRDTARLIVYKHWLCRSFGKPILSASTVMMLLSGSVSSIPLISLPMDRGRSATRRDVVIKALAVYSARLHGEEDALSRDLGHRQVRQRQ